MDECCRGFGALTILLYMLPQCPALAPTGEGCREAHTTSLLSRILLEQLLLQGAVYTPS